MVEHPSASAEDTGDVGLVLGSGRSPGGGHGSPLQCSRLENPMDGGAWRRGLRELDLTEQLSTLTPGTAQGCWCLHVLTSAHDFLIFLIAILIDLKWYFLVLMGASLMITDIKYLFMCLLAI